jgi:2-haloacid dehalogenase
MTNRPTAVVFDVIETLMSLEPLRARLTDIGQPPGLLEAWYTRTLRDGMALSTTGDYVPFTEVAESSLRGLADHAISDDQVSHVMSGFAELPAYPDAVPAATALTEAGLRVACLTNGTAFLTSSFVNRTGLGSLVDRVISVGEVYRWKPAGVVYLYAAEVLNTPPERLALIAAHDWDCHGSRASSLSTTSIRFLPATSGGANGAPKAPGLRLTQPVVSPARLAPWQSQSWAAMSARRSGGVFRTSAAYR